MEKLNEEELIPDYEYAEVYEKSIALHYDILERVTWTSEFLLRIFILICIHDVHSPGLTSRVQMLQKAANVLYARREGDRLFLFVYSILWISDSLAFRRLLMLSYL